MRIVFWILILFFLAIFEVSFLPKFLGNFLIIDLVFSTVLSLSMVKKEREALFFGAIGGLFLDLFSANFFGLATLSLTLTCFVAAWAVRSVFTKFNFLVLLTAGFSMTVFYYGFFSFFSWLSHFLGGNFWFIFTKDSLNFLLSQSIINTFLFLGMFYLIKFLNGLFKPR